ncbi:MAG: isoprenylcysteine carboxylmethyltransferase family protein [Gammaproteobacteria bacterium]|nr:isoprenylcysteine carboxylmethyltransferase family protein [Gammaproteobacteria bacterium]
MDQPRDAAKVRFFPPGVPLLTMVIGYGLNRLMPLSDSYPLDAPTRYYIGGALAVASVLVFGLWPVVMFRQGGQSENPWKPTTHIEWRGPYKVSRNPMYLQMILVCIGVSIAFANWWTLLLTPLAAWALFAVAIAPEEAYLEAKFGEPYLAYKRKVRRWI